MGVSGENECRAAIFAFQQESAELLLSLASKEEFIMRYSSGNYEAFVRPRKPEGGDRKTAWFVGSGLAGLAGAAFLIRDGGVAGEHISILEELAVPGPLSLDPLAGDRGCERAR
ncbi:hypothetical protein HL653_11260 [Sphingomonas sp. AP4-R1]|nr:hypothetical protein HL653_11260 [Sphingomonas sp. AP4-R1]